MCLGPPSAGLTRSERVLFVSVITRSNYDASFITPIARCASVLTHEGDFVF